MQEDNQTIIVGGGLAGLTLGYFFYKQNIPFKIITKKENHSSLIAAGLINPIVFRRTTKSWEVDKFLPFAKTFYKEVEHLLGKEIWHDIAIRRSFSHEQEKNDWLRKKQLDNYNLYLGEMNTPSPSNLYTEFGTGIVKQGAWIDTENFVFGLRDFFEKQGNLSYTNLSADDAKQFQNAKIIFCEGYELINNPFFNYLPLDPTKGQTLTIQSNDIPEDESINRKCFVLPIGEKHFRVGATYEWSDASLNITEESKTLLENDLKNLIQAQYTICKQQAGVRPTVKDRRPLLGQHPTHENLYVFNGLGTKGYLIAPFMANEMYNYLFCQKSLNPEVNIARYENLFSN